MASRQFGVVTGGQLRGLGMTQRAIEGRVAAGRLHRLHRGVYAVGHQNLSTNASFIAAVLAVGDGAALSHASAAALFGFAAAEHGPVHVTVARRVAQRKGIAVHPVRALPVEDTTRHHGIWTTTAARTLLDLAGVLTERALRRAVHEAEVQRRVNQRQLEDQLARANGRTGAALLEAVVADGPTPTRSELEERTLELLIECGYQPKTNACVEDVPGEPEVDFFFPEFRLVVEADGGRYHDTPHRRREDAKKQALLEAHGYRVIRVTWHQVTRKKEQTALRLAAATGAPPPGAPRTTAQAPLALAAPTG